VAPRSKFGPDVNDRRASASGGNRLPRERRERDQPFADRRIRGFRLGDGLCDKSAGD
jgi:hypothetical protein